MIGIIKEGLRPGGHRGGRTQVFLNPFVPWDRRYKDILGVMINASGQMVVNGNISLR